VDNSLWRDGMFRFVVYGEQPPTQINAVTQTRQVPIAKSEHPLAYYRHSIKMALCECDVILALGVGISLFSVLPRLHGVPLIVHPDGAEWKRTKWSALGRLALRLLYLPTLLFADRIIVDAEALRSDFPAIFGHKMVYIAYQATPVVPSSDPDAVLKDLGITGPFMLTIARLEPENSIGMILDGFALAQSQEQTLVVVGATSTSYYQNCLADRRIGNVRFLGGIFDPSILNVLRSRCSAYIHGHTIGGSPPSLIEAQAGVNGRLFCRDNKYNREVTSERAEYFADAEELCALIKAVPGATVPSATPYDDERFRPSHITEMYRRTFMDISKH
jgi:glycosyltransferase involved in cell wall biosynthesis